VLRVTADSNIYISALHFGGPPDDFLNLARAGLAFAGNRSLIVHSGVPFLFLRSSF
jgi:hypothetical protein